MRYFGFAFAGLGLGGLRFFRRFGFSSLGLSAAFAFAGFSAFSAGAFSVFAAAAWPVPAACVEPGVPICFLFLPQARDFLCCPADQFDNDKKGIVALALAHFMMRV